MTTIPLRPIAIRILLLILIVAGLVAISWPIIRAAIGDSVMTFVQRNPNLAPEAQLQGADIATYYAANDPLAHLGRGRVYLAAANDEQSEEKLATSLTELRLATAMSPADYRVWLALGRALDRSGDSSGARSALEKSVNLAPKHFDPRWAMGNFLLRNGDRDAAFAQFRQALAGRSSALPLIFDYAWEAFQGDGRAIAKAMAPTGETQAQLIVLLIGRNRVPDALAVWRETAPHTPDEAEQVATALFYAGQMSAAYNVWSSSPSADRPLPDVNSLLANGDFEKQLSINSKTPFLTWRIVPIGGVKVSIDRKDPNEGQQSLRVGFDARENIPMTVVSQTVPVKPSTSYVLGYAVKTEELRSLSMPIVEVIDAADAGRLRAVADKWPLGDRDWREEQIKFTTNAQTEAVTVRLQRQPCAEPPCPIDGRVWLDAFKLSESK